jgi:hypothetical protein
MHVKVVTVNKLGLYLQLDQRFAEKSGLFIPYQGIEIKAGRQNDPSYEILSNGVYKYRIRGQAGLKVTAKTK